MELTRVTDPAACPPRTTMPSLDSEVGEALGEEIVCSKITVAVDQRVVLENPSRQLTHAELGDAQIDLIGRLEAHGAHELQREIEREHEYGEVEAAVHEAAIRR